MKCEHAQDFFSEYIEQTLDKPAVVALEAHLTACASCRRDMEGLRQTFDALSVLPAVEPPQDLAWRVLVQLQRERVEKLEAERKRVNPVVGWLQSLTPGAAFGYAMLVAILFVALAFPQVRGPMQTIFGFGGGDQTVLPPSVSRPSVPPAAGTPLVSFRGAYQEAQNGQWFYRLLITAPAEMRNAVASISPAVMVNGELTSTREMRRPLTPNQPMFVPIPAAVPEGRVQAVLIRVAAPGVRPFSTVVNVPGYDQRSGM